jgi:hypothetical protein
MPTPRWLKLPEPCAPRSRNNRGHGQIQIPAPRCAGADIHDERLAREKLGDMLVYIMNEQRGASNAKAKRELNWNPLTPSWRSGFAALYSN